jgi:hypothetical protein
MPDYLEGDLDLMKRALLDAHLDGCEACSRDFAEMRATIALLRGMPDPEPPPFLASRVMARIRDGEGRRTVGDRVRDFLRALASPQTALPATALGLGLLMATGVLDPSSISLDRLDRLRAGERAQETTVSLPVVTDVATRYSGERGSVFAARSQPPAVAPAPRVRIALPGQGSSRSGDLTRLVSSAGGSRPITRWSSRSVRSAASPLAMNVAATPVASADRRVTAGSAFQTAAGEGPTLLDQRLDAMVAEPARAAGEFARHSIFEQERLLRSLAERAHDQDRGEEVLEALHRVPDLRARQLASALSAEMRRIDNASVASLQAESASGSR